MTMSTVIGVDIGGTKIAAGRVSSAGRIDGLRRCHTPATEGSTAVLDAVVRLVKEVRGTTPVVAVGVSTGGIVDHATGTIVAATDLIAGWAGCGVADELSNRLGVPVSVDNDGNCFALAESRLGLCAPTTICVAVGTGIGGGILVDGRLLRGINHLAGEFGHLTVDTIARCSCGKVGHLEALAAGPALNARYLAAGGTASSFQAAIEGSAPDPVTRRVIWEGGRILGRAIAGPVLTLDADLVVLGGGVAEIGHPYLAAVESGLREALPHQRPLRVRGAAGGTNSAVIGAAILMEQR
jgi:glucokinase